MAKYDYASAKEFIQANADKIDSVSMGMAEDWYWTAETVFSNGKFEINIDDEPPIAGIKSSHWATPSMLVVMKDGSVKMLDCFTGGGPKGDRPEWLQRGEMSGPCQQRIDSLRGKDADI